MYMRFVVEAGSECKGSFYFLFVFHIKREAFPVSGKGLSFYVVDFCLSNHRDISSVQEYFFLTSASFFLYFSQVVVSHLIIKK
jgi:hypothetical protein